MSRAANPNKPNKKQEESEAAIAAKKHKAERERIRRLIITLGDDNKKIISQIRGLAGALEDDVELHGELMTQTLLDSAANLSLKSAIYAAWLAKMAEANAKWAAEALSKILEELRASLRGGKAGQAQLLIRFLLCCSNTGLLGVNPVLGFLQEVLGLSEGMKPNRGGDFAAFMALAPLPYLSPAAYKLAKEKVESLIAAAQPYLSSRGASWKSLLQVVRGQDLPDRLEDLLSALTSMSSSEWACQAVLHPPSFVPAAESKPDMPELSLGITAEEFKKSRISFKVPLVSSRWVTSSLKDAGSAMPAQDRWVLEDYILLCIEMFGQDVEECSKQVLRIPVLHPQFEAVLVETIFSQLLRLPTPTHLPLFFCRLLEVTAEKQNTMKKLIDQAYQVLCENLVEMDEDSFEVLAESFAYYLMHNAFQADWSVFTREGVEVQEKRFIRRCLERLLRMSFHQNLVLKLPQALHAFIPSEPAPASGLPIVSKPEFGRMISFVRIRDANVDKALEYCNWLLKLDTTQGPNTAGEQDDKEPDAKRRKVEAGSGDTSKSDQPAAGDDKEEEAKEKEKDAKDQASASTAKPSQADFGEAPAKAWALEEVVELVAFVMLQQGRNTPTHMGKLLDGNQQLLLKLKPAEDAEAHSFAKRIARCAFDFWRLSGQRLEITVDTLLHRGLVTPRAAVEVALAQGGESMAVWNIINAVAKRSIEHSHAARAALALAKKLDKEDMMEKSRKQLDEALSESNEIFTLIFTRLVQNFKDFRGKDEGLRRITLQRITGIGRKYGAFIKPVIEAAESRIAGLTESPEVAEVFKTLTTLYN